MLLGLITAKIETTVGVYVYLNDPFATKQKQYVKEIKLYESALYDFLANPKDKSNLP